MPTNTSLPQSAMETYQSQARTTSMPYSNTSLAPSKAEPPRSQHFPVSDRGELLTMSRGAIIEIEPPTSQIKLPRVPGLPNVGIQPRPRALNLIDDSQLYNFRLIMTMIKGEWIAHWEKRTGFQQDKEAHHI